MYNHNFIFTDSPFLSLSLLLLAVCTLRNWEINSQCQPVSQSLRSWSPALRKTYRPVATVEASAVDMHRKSDLDLGRFMDFGDRTLRSGPEPGKMVLLRRDNTTVGSKHSNSSYSKAVCNSAKPEGHPLTRRSASSRQGRMEWEPYISAEPSITRSRTQKTYLKKPQGMRQNISNAACPGERLGRSQKEDMTKEHCRTYRWTPVQHYVRAGQ